MKVGIVGRTGAGKSSILQVLFRLCEIEKGEDSSVKIDGVDIRDIGLHMLRKNVAYIPQSPFLIHGTVRENLDPHEEYTDEEVWEVLDKVKLKSVVKNMSQELLTKVTENNNLFSMGEK